MRPVQKIIFKIGLAFASLLIAGVPVLADSSTPSLSLSPSSGGYNIGCKFTLDINLDTAGVETDGTDAILLYDQTRFSALSVKSGSIYPDYPGNSVSTPGKVTVSGLSSISQGYKGAGTLATVEFQVLSTAPQGLTQIKFDFDSSDKTKTTDSNIVQRGVIGDVLGQVTDGNYTIGTGPCTAPTSTPTPTPRAGYVYITQAPVYTGGSGDGKVVYAQGGPVDGKQPVDTGKSLAKSGSVQTTLLLGGVAGFLILVGIIGLVAL